MKMSTSSTSKRGTTNSVWPTGGKRAADRVIRNMLLTGAARWRGVPLRGKADLVHAFGAARVDRIQQKVHAERRATAARTGGFAGEHGWSFSHPPAPRPLRGVRLNGCTFNARSLASAGRLSELVAQLEINRLGFCMVQGTRWKDLPRSQFRFAGTSRVWGVYNWGAPSTDSHAGVSILVQERPATDRDICQVFDTTSQGRVGALRIRRADCDFCLL